MSERGPDQGGSADRFGRASGADGSDGGTSRIRWPGSLSCQNDVPSRMRDGRSPESTIPSRIGGQRSAAGVGDSYFRA